MSDEAILVVALLGGIAVMCVVLVRYMRRKEARLAAQTEIEIPIHSLPKSVFVCLLAVLIGSVPVPVFGAVTDPWGRRHALAMVLAAIGLALVALLVALRLSRRFRTTGLLRYTPTRLELQLGDQRWHVDLDQPYELREGFASGPADTPLQVLYVKQGDDGWGFSYGLPLARKPYGGALDTYFTPLVGGEARVIHDRLRRPRGPES